MAEYPHGDVNRYRHGGCRCRRCTAANARVMNTYRLAVARGTHRPDVDAGPVRRHVLQLRAAGMASLRIAQLAGVSVETVRNLQYGKPSRGQAPTKRMRPWTAERVLAVRIGPLPERGWVPGAGTRRRLHALVCLGWPLTVLATQGGMSEHTLQRLSSSPADARVEAATARKVADLFQRLSRVTPTSAGVSPATVKRMRTLAARKGWVSAAAWNDIDDPSERPKGLRREAS